VAHTFGTSFAREFYPTVDDGPLSIVGQAAEIYLYSGMPSLTDAVTGAGSFATISSWTQTGTTPYKATYTVPALIDPTPTSKVPSRGYWEVIRFAVQTGQEKQTVVRQFEVERVYAGASEPETTVQDLKDMYPAISAYASDSQLTEHLSIAKEELKADLLARNLKWSRVEDKARLNLALVYKTIANVAESQVREANDKHTVRVTRFEEKYNRALENAPLEVDFDEDGEPDTKTEAKQKVWFNIR
jgi:hypothetical protein